MFKKHTVKKLSCHRQAEFARAALTRMLDGTSRRPEIRYCGYFRHDQKDVIGALEEKVYQHWDDSDLAPPRARPAETLPEPSLTLLTWCNGAPSFPNSVVEKFAEGSPAFLEVNDMKKRLVEEFGQRPASGAPASGGANNRARAGGRPDFQIEGGKKPLDFSRTVEIAHTPATSFEVQRTNCYQLLPIFQLQFRNLYNQSLLFVNMKKGSMM